MFKTNFKQSLLLIQKSDDCAYLTSIGIYWDVWTNVKPPLAVYLEADLFFSQSLMISYKYRYNAQSVIFSFYLLSEYKITERAIGFFFIRKTAFTWKRNMASHTNTLQGRSMFKNTVLFWILEKKRSLFTVKLCSVKVLYLRKKTY